MSDGEGELETVRRFSSRAGEYARHRPSYPEAVLDELERRDYLDLGTRVADVGAGTGIFAEQLIGKGCEVWAVEPNGAMRSVAETSLGDRHQFHSVTGDAADIPLDDGTVELVTAAHAFHWFDAGAARREFVRILEPPHRAALIWNIRDPDGSEFMRALEDVLDEFGVDYSRVADSYHDQIDRLEDFFVGAAGEPQGGYRHRTFEHTQKLGRQGLIGLVTSFSYMPRPGADRFEESIEALRDVFDLYSEDGAVEIVYDTELYVGEIRSG